MSTRLSHQLATINQKKRVGIMTHVVAGYPTLEKTEELVQIMARAGVDMVEIQIPFSDPLADGPTIMMANDRALHNHVTMKDVFALVRRLNQKVKMPLLLMGYYHSLFSYGLTRFLKEAQAAGVEALIIPDIPFDEEPAEHFLQECRAHDLTAIRVISPTCTEYRITRNVEIGEGFIYCTAVAGTTGVRQELAMATKQFLNRVKAKTTLPLAVGFGISQPAHIAALKGYATMAVVGSAVIQKIEQEGVTGIESYLKKLVQAGR